MDQIALVRRVVWRPAVCTRIAAWGIGAVIRCGIIDRCTGVRWRRSGLHRRVILWQCGLWLRLIGCCFRWGIVGTVSRGSITRLIVGGGVNDFRGRWRGSLLFAVLYLIFSLAVDKQIWYILQGCKEKTNKFMRGLRGWLSDGQRHYNDKQGTEPHRKHRWKWNWGKFAVPHRNVNGPKGFRARIGTRTAAWWSSTGSTIWATRLVDWLIGSGFVSCLVDWLWEKDFAAGMSVGGARARLELGWCGSGPWHGHWFSHRTDSGCGRGINGLVVTLVIRGCLVVGGSGIGILQLEVSLSDAEIWSELKIFFEKKIQIYNTDFNLNINVFKLNPNLNIKFNETFQAKWELWKIMELELSILHNLQISLVFFRWSNCLMHNDFMPNSMNSSNSWLFCWFITYRTAHRLRNRVQITGNEGQH